MWQPNVDGPPLYRAADVQRRFAAGEIAILDVREADEWDDGHIAGAHWIPLGDLEDRFTELDPQREWICVCHLGQRSAMAAGMLQEEGFRVGNLLGGMAAWASAGFPEESGRGTPHP